jgi:hypothetical protein
VNKQEGYAEGPLLHDLESGREKWYRHFLSVQAPYIVYGRALWRGTSIFSQPG